LLINNKPLQRRYQKSDIYYPSKAKALPRDFYTPKTQCLTYEYILTLEAIKKQASKKEYPWK